MLRAIDIIHTHESTLHLRLSTNSLISSIRFFMSNLSTSIVSSPSKFCTGCKFSSASRSTYIYIYIYIFTSTMNIVSLSLLFHGSVYTINSSAFISFTIFPVYPVSSYICICIYITKI